MLKNLQQLFDRLAAAENGGRAAGEVDERGMRVNAEMAVDGGQQVLRGQWPLDRVLRLRGRRADELPRLPAAAGDEGGLGLRPVVASDAAVGGGEAGGAAEFPHRDDGNFFG